MKELVRPFLRTLGYRVIRLRNLTSQLNSFFALDSFFALLKQRGFAPNHIVDVGANRGNWTRAALKYFPDAYYTLIEPQDHLRKYVQDLLAGNGRIRWIGVGASDKPGILPFTLARETIGSSFTPTAEAAKAAGLCQIEVPVMTLNDIVQTRDAPFPDMIKIDAEGFDLRVLAGASELVGKTDIFLLEVAICSRADNTLTRVIHAMDHAGYGIFDITDLNRSPKYGALWLCEVAFLRRASHLLDGVDSYQ